MRGGRNEEKAGHTGRECNIETKEKISEMKAGESGDIPDFAPEVGGICMKLSEWNMETAEYTRAACSRRALSCTKYSEPAGAFVASERARRGTARRATEDMLSSDGV